MATPIPKNAAAFSLSEVVSTTAGELRGDFSGSVVGVCTDTRAVAEGELFVALRGERFDGHDHLAKAAAAGAVLALVDRDVDAPLPTVRVASTLDALGALAGHHIQRWRSASDGRVLALTGSAGKTTIKTAIGALVGRSASHQVVVTAGNMNNRIGMPMTALGLDDRHRFAVLELGTNEPGEIAALASIAEPDVALLTLIAAAHTEGLGGIEGVAKEKASLFDCVAADGAAIGNADDARVVAALEAAQARERITYGFSETATYRIHGRAIDTLRRQRVTVEGKGRRFDFATPLLGDVGALACTGAIAAYEALCGDVADVELVEQAMIGAAGSLGDRMRPRELGDGTVIIDDSYNANPASCRASITTAAEIAKHLSRRLVLVLGEMRELGGVSQREHEALGALAAAAGDVVIFVAGDAVHAQRAAEGAHFAGDADAAARLAVAEVRAGDVVLVKGSRGVRTERVVEALTAGGAA